MSQKIIHGYTEAELDALRISFQQRNQCVQYLVPYKRCFLSRSLWSQVINDECAQLKRDYAECAVPKFLKKTGYGAFQMKKHDMHKFEEEKVSPTLASRFSPTLLTTTIGGH